MLKIVNIDTNSEGYKKGIRKNDKIITINGYKAQDNLDLIYYSYFEKIKIKLENKGFFILNTDSLGIEVEEFNIKKCVNDCIFCFVSQMPSGLRKELYLKDDDYRMSFLYGSYITLNNLKENDYERIERLRLSPLYISVHTVDSKLRNKIMRSKIKINIKEKIKRLINMNIKLHTQLVLIPGINDGKKLNESLDFLLDIYPDIQTVTVVPLGLTKHRDGLQSLKSYSKKTAEKVVKKVEKYQKNCIERYGGPVVYLTDEFYIKAEEEFGKYRNNEIYDNGVGMFETFKEKFRDNINILKNKNFDKSKKIGIITSVDGEKLLKRFIKKMNNLGIDINFLVVKNNFFGRLVTVTGLLCGNDIKKIINEKINDYDKILIPDIVLNSNNMFLDGFKKEDILKINKNKLKFIPTNAEALIEEVTS